MSKILDYDGLTHLVDKLKSIFYQKPSAGIPKNDLTSALQKTIPEFGIVYGSVSIQYKTANSGATTSFKIPGVSKVHAVLFVQCFDSQNVRIKTVSDTDPTPVQTASSTGVTVTAMTPKMSSAGSRSTMYVAIVTKK